MHVELTCSGEFVILSALGQTRRLLAQDFLADVRAAGAQRLADLFQIARRKPGSPQTAVYGREPLPRSQAIAAGLTISRRPHQECHVSE